MLFAPMALHYYSAMLGQALLAPIKSGISGFDNLYNRRHWLFSLLAGVSLVIAFAIESLGTIAFHTFFVVAFLFILVDGIGCTLSIGEWARRK